MSAWSNIETSQQDAEIKEIDNFELALGDIPENVKQIRELITRFEVCHFKYKQHLKKIKDSIPNLKPNIEPVTIGSNHISKGEYAFKNDTTGRSLLGQQYLYGLKKWLGENPQEKDSEYHNVELEQKIVNWLGDKNDDKERLVRLLIARLTWDWKLYEEYQDGGEYKELEYQVCRMDICHYTFTKNLDSLLPGIGNMKPIENFEGCGTFNSDIKTFIDGQFSILHDYLKSKTNKIGLGKNERIKLWLTACFAKTLKEQIGLTTSMPHLL